MFLTGVWEPTFIENFLLHSLYLINYAAIALIAIAIIGIIYAIIKKIKEHKYEVNPK